MKLVINIPEYLYEAIMINRFGIFSNAPCEVIRKGTLLPKGHGRLIDADELILPSEEIISRMAVASAQTVIEADKGGRE